MEISVNKIRRCVAQLFEQLQSTQRTAEDDRVLRKFLNTNDLGEKDVEALFTILSDHILEEPWTAAIATSFEHVLLLLIIRSIPCNEQVDETDFETYQRKCIALTTMMRLSVDTKRYAVSYFRNKPAPFECPKLTAGNSYSKRSKNSTPITPLDIVKCCYHLLSVNPVFFKDLWNWSVFLDSFIDCDKLDDLYQLYCNHIIAVLTNMTATQLQNMNALLSPAALLQFDEERDIRARFTSNKSFEVTQQDTSITYKINSHAVTDIEGVLLPIFNKNNYEFYSHNDGLHENIVKVDSTKVNLRSIALGIASAKAICLSGPVGCGKTTLVEYLARNTGRIQPKPTEIEQTNLENGENKASNGKENVNGNDKFAAGSKRKHGHEILTEFDETIDAEGVNSSGFLRIQLGDQTDSKMLLGQYRCTDVPGEFVWLPGVLTQAVMNGYWLLLEDLDSATQDTYTILSSLLENNYLSVPGFRDCVKIEPGFQLFVTVRTNKSSTTAGQKSLYTLLEKYLYTINILPLSRNELCKVVSTNYPKLATVSNRIVDVFLTFSSGDHTLADNLRQQEFADKADTTEKYIALPFEQISLSSIPNSGRLVSTRDLIKLCQRSNPLFSVTSTECAYFVFQNAVDVFCSYLPQGTDKTKLIISIGAKLGIIQSRCEYFADQYKPEVLVNKNRIKVGRTELCVKPLECELGSELADLEEKTDNEVPQASKRQKLNDNLILDSQIAALKRALKGSKNSTFSFTRMTSCILERIAVCVSHAEPVLLVGETGVGKTSSVQYLAERTCHKLVVVNMNNQSDVSDLIGGFKPVDLSYVMAPMRLEFHTLFCGTFNADKNQTFLHKLEICYNQLNFAVIIKLMLSVINSVFTKAEKNELRQKEMVLLPRWQALKVNALKLNAQLSKSINISFAFIPGSLVNCIKNGDWILLDEINLASAEMLECLSTILEPDGSVVLLERGDFTPVKRHSDFRIFACMNPNTDIGKKDLPVGIRNRFTEFFVDELTTDVDLTLLISDYLKNTGIQRKSVANLVQLYKKLKLLSRLELNDGLGNRPVFSLRTLCRSLRICGKNLCGSVERNLYESFCMSFLTQLDTVSHNVVLHLIQQALLSNVKAILNQTIPKPGENYLNFEGYWIEQGPKEPEEYASYILTKSVKENLRDLSRIISIGKLPVLLQGPTSAGKTSLIDYVARRSGNHCLRINNHEHTDLQEYIGTYVADVTGKLSFMEGILVQAMRNGYWIILDELNLASTDILEALNRVLDDNRELFIPETQTLVKAHPNFMLFATQNPPGLYGGRKTLSRAFKNRFIELHFSEIPRDELETILEKRCLIPTTYAKKMVLCMSDLQKNRKTTSKNVFTLRDLFRWGNRYTYADKQLLEDKLYDWNQHLIEEGYLVLSAKVRTDIEIEIIEDTLYKNFRKRIDLSRLFDAQSSAEACSAVTRNIIASIKAYKLRADIVWTRNMTRMAVLTAKALQFNEPVLLVGPTGCGKTTVCQLLASIRGVQLRILNCHMHTEGADFLGGLRPCRESSDENNTAKKLFEWADGPLILAMQEGSYFMSDEISLAEDSVLERLNCILEPDRTVLLAEKGGVGESDNPAELAKDFVVQAQEGFQFLATMNPGGDFGKKELSPALRNRFTEIWCLPSDTREDLIHIASNCMLENLEMSVETSRQDITKIASYLVEVVLHMRHVIDKFKYSIRDILAWANYIVSNAHLTFPERAIFGLETIFLDALEMLPHETLEKVTSLRRQIVDFAIEQAASMLSEKFTFADLEEKRGKEVLHNTEKFGIKPFFIPTNSNSRAGASKSFLFEAPTTKQNLFRLLSALSLRKPILLEGPPGVGKTSTVESIAAAIGFRIVRINLCEHTDLADLFGTDLPAEDNILDAAAAAKATNETPGFAGSFVWRDGPLLAALKADNTWILLDELNLAPQSVLEGLNAILDHRGEVYIPELNKTFTLNKETRVFACQNPLKQGGGRKGLPQSFLNRFNKVYLRKLTTQDLLFVVNGKYETYFVELHTRFAKLLTNCSIEAGTNLFEFYKKSIKDATIQGTANDETVAPTIDLDLSKRLVQFSEILDNGIVALEFGYRGGPYEINLRDILRWCDLLVHPETGFIFQTDIGSAATTRLDLFRKNFENFLLTLYERMKLVYYQRMRCEEDKRYIRNAFSKVFDCDADQLNAISEDVSLYWTADKIYLNDIVLDRNGDQQGLRPLRSRDLCPVLLTSQREMLKNVGECVRMEKPVLLCGPTDTGKTKLIDLLCTLSNQVCNTDTIDDSVTGSFQQIDLNRHLEEISQSIEAVLAAHLRSLILEQKSKAYKSVAQLLQVWSQYCKESNVKLAKNNATSMSDELVSFRKRIQRLNNVIGKVLQSMSDSSTTCTALSKETLVQQQSRLSALKNHVRNADSLNTGGSFEWLDSKIVKSLKFGQYILLEHVNLCSSAVLDRLNPVFEPNGNLLISEKGVSANESAEIVEKAPNFHAFLTIDPKNGELSRAMRNRCVELAIAKDTYSTDDMRLMIYLNGVRGMRAINSILNIHTRLLHSTEINNYNISHLTQFAFLTASYARIGYDMERAIYVSSMEVYVYAANTDLMGFGLAYYQNKLREMVLEESKKFGAVDASYPHDDEDRLGQFLQHSDELNALTLIKLQTEPISSLLRYGARAHDALTEIFAEFESVDFTKVDTQQLIKYCIYLLYESSSISDAELRYLYLEKLLRATPSLQSLSNALFASIKHFSPQLESSLHQLPWNNKLFPRIRAYGTQLADAKNHKSFCLSAQLVAHLLVQPMPQPVACSVSDMNALTYSLTVASNKVVDRYDNVLLQNLATFLARMREVLNAALDYAHIDVDTFAALITAYLWHNRLLAISQGKLVVNKELNRNLLDKLVLHFKWVEKNLLQLLTQMLPNYCQLNAEFSSSLQKIDNYVLSTKLPLNLMRKVYNKNLTHFAPFYQAEQVKFYKLVRQMDQLLEVVPTYGSYTPEIVLKKFSAQKTDNARRARAIVNGCVEQRISADFKQIQLQNKHSAKIPGTLQTALLEFTNIATANNDLSHDDLATLEAEVEALQKLVNSREDLATELQPKEYEIRLLSLREFFLAKALCSLGSSSAPEDALINETYCEEIASLSNVTWQLIKMRNSGAHKRYAEVGTQLVKYLASIEIGDDFEQLLLYLNGGYKFFNSYHTRLQHAANNMQLRNLATRDNTTNVLRAVDDIDCAYTYDGNAFLNVYCSLVFQENGSLRPVPLNELPEWQAMLKQLHQLIWQNAALVTPQHNTWQTNWHVAQSSASKLLHEVAYVKKLCDSLENENFSEYNESFQKLVQCLTDAHAQTTSAEHAECAAPEKKSALYYQSVQYQASLFNSLIGAIEVCLLTFTPLIDPVEKNRLKNLYVVEDINCLSTMTTAYDFMRIVMKYNHFGAEIYVALEERLKALQEKQLKYAQKLALRPEKCLYSKLVDDITHYLTTNCAPQAMLALIQNAQKSWTQLTSDVQASSTVAEMLKTNTELLNKLNLWITNSQRFLNHTLKAYMDHYQDFIQPLQYSVDKLRYGFEGLKVVLTQASSNILELEGGNVFTNLNANNKLSSALANIAQFPVTQHLMTSDVQLSSRAVLKQRSYLNTVMQQLPNSEHSYFGLLKAKLIELRNTITISAHLNEEIFYELDYVFNVSNQIWQAEEERRRAQKAEEESLYVNKTRCAEEDEELLELQEIESYFPTNVEEDFGEFLIEATLEKVVKLDKKSSLKTQATQVIRDEDYSFLARHFIDLMAQYTRIYYHKPALNTAAATQLEFIAPFEARMQAFVPLYAHYKRGLNDWLTEVAYNSCTFALALQQQQLGNANSTLLGSSAHSYNYYKHANIPEIMGCLDLLKDIEVHADEQLALYPEHASLIDIKRVIARIRTLPATAPVVRFNTGFQLLRQKLAQWNEVAHKGNHMHQQEVAVAEYVQRWMKLELQCWRSCLNQTKAQIESNAHKYWFFIYQLLQEYLHERALDSSYTDIKNTEKRFGAGEVLDAVDVDKKTKVSAADIVGILRQFVEAANYGDFHVRLQLLQAFELYLHNVDHLAAQSGPAVDARTLVAGLHNLHIYFTQFAQEIEETTLRMRAPIEKKLKELVKIESYNKDLSYFSMRNNVARVHRNLNKFLKEYQLQLQQKITPVFQPTDATVKDYNFENDKGRELRYDTRIKYYLVEVKNFVAAQKLANTYAVDVEAAGSELALEPGDQSLLSKVGRLFKTSRSVVKETVSNASFSKLIIALDSVLCVQLERCEELRALNVDRSKERPKQIVEAKQILQQKRKGLTDLFKTLTQLGLSFKTGLMELSLRADFAEFTLPPFCVKTMLGARSDKRQHTHLLHLNENLDRYYAKCEFKLRLLQNIMLTPLSELGPPNIERIKGFVVDMFLLVQSQRRLLATTSKQIYDLEQLMQHVKEIHQVSCVGGELAQVVNGLAFSEARDSYLTLRESISRMRYVMEQFSLLLRCAPNSDSEVNNVLTPCENRLLQNSPHFTAISANCAEVLKTAKATLVDMLNNDKEFLNVAKVAAYRATHDKLCLALQQIAGCLSNAAGASLPIAKPIVELLDFVESCSKRLSTPAEFNAPTDLESLEAVLERILHAVLLALQKLYKKYAETSAAPTDESLSPSRAHNELELQEKHLKEQLHAALECDWQTLNIASIVEQLSNVLLTLKHAKPSQSKLSCARKLTTLMPILEQYYLLADYYLFQQLGAHKVSAKMLSVMLTVFVEIGSKGFCVPPDLMQDEEGQAKEQKDGEGFGLEDGTGENDASDKIESEDQLDDAKRPEDRKEEEGKQQEDCKQDKGIEMSDDFDANVQDLEKPEEDDSGDSEDDDELNKEMGETGEEADKLDEQIWGDDDDEKNDEEEDENEPEEDQGKGTKDENDKHNDLDAKNDAANENDQDNEGLDAVDEPTNENRKQQEKDIDNMKEPEVDEDQDNPYHNELEEPPEAEEMDLGDMNADDEQEEGDEREDEENPFDIDKMKENMEVLEDQTKEEDTKEDENQKESKTDDSDSEDGEEDAKLRKEEQKDEDKQEDEDAKAEEEAEPETQTRGEQEPETAPEEKEEEEQEHTEKPEEYEQSKDKMSKEENVQSVPETENKGTPDQVQSENDQDVKQDQKLDEQETGDEKDGVGQAENDTNDGGHQGIADAKEKVAQDESSKEQKIQEKRKQGKTDEERTLGEAEKNEIKQLKTMDKTKEQQQGEDENENDPEADAEEFQHVKDAKSSDKTTLDNATEEQSKQTRHEEEKQDDENEETENNDNLEEEEADANKLPDEEQNLQEMSAEKFDQKSDKPAKAERSKEHTEAHEEMKVEGEVVATMTVTRSDDTSAHCNKEMLLENLTRSEELSTAELLEMRRVYQQQLTANKAALPMHEDYETWQTISHRMAQNARELCEQLRLILEPTKCTRLKGDYRTGRRINMKKIIPYIASQFRKDKIWLRRTKPAQRDYKITIAIDDSKSMHHNNSKTLTLEAISLVSQALTLLESGRLSIVSFGESPQIILNHTEQFDGPKLVNALNFAQDKTKIGELLDFVRTANMEESALGTDNGLFENLLLVLSDGRNIFSEGRVKVRNAIKLARMQRIFLVYIIIDNPENKDSILDIQSMEMLPDKRINIKSYLDDFPFPYYVIVRDLNQLPLVLSEAMRQWFELVNSEM